MAQMAAPLVDQVMPWGPRRQWGVSGPLPLRSWLASAQDLTATVQTIIRTTRGQDDVTQAVASGHARAPGHPGSVTFLPRFGRALTLQVPYPLLCLAGVHLDRTAQSLKPRFMPGVPPTDTDIAAVIQTLRRRVRRALRQRGSLAADLEAPVATGDDPLRDTAPALARPLAASVPHRIASGERAGQPGRRLGAGFGHAGAAPRLTGPHGASVNGFALPATTAMPAPRRDHVARLIRYPARGAVALERLQADANGELVSTCTPPGADGTLGLRLSPLALLEQLAALGPLPPVPLVRYGGCLAPPSPLRGALLPTPRQHGLDAPEACPAAPRWRWARGLQRVGAVAMATWPFGQRGRLRLIAVSTPGEVSRKSRRHLQRAGDPRPIAPARPRPERYAFA